MGCSGKGVPQPAKPPERAKAANVSAQPGACRCPEAISSSASPTSWSGLAKAERHRPLRTQGRARNLTPKPSSTGGRGMGLPVRPAGASNNSRSIRSWQRRASSTATDPPMEAPIKPKGPGVRSPMELTRLPRCCSTASGLAAGGAGRGQKPKPYKSGMNSWQWGASRGASRRNSRNELSKPCSISTGGPAPTTATGHSAPKPGSCHHWIRAARSRPWGSSKWAAASATRALQVLSRSRSRLLARVVWLTPRRARRCRCSPGLR